MNKGNDNGAWIFVSHSLKDWNKVRKIRDELEEKGHKPLLFFLKCLQDDSEVDNLIKREIEARNWFVLCDSPNARESKWVKSEVDFIKSLPDKVYKVIDLDGDTETLADIIESLSKRITVFLSYSHNDTQMAKDVAAKLEKSDYRVLMDLNLITPAGRWSQQVLAGIDQAIKEGFVLLLISDNSIKAPFVLAEVEYAFKKCVAGQYGNNIIPIFITDPNATIQLMPIGLKSLISKIQYFDLSKGNFNQNIKKLITTLKTIKME